MNKQALKLLAFAAERLCTMKDRFEILTRMEALLFGRDCILALWSLHMDEKYNLGVWRGRPSATTCDCEARYHDGYPYPGCGICGEQLD